MDMKTIFNPNIANYLINNNTRAAVEDAQATQTAAAVTNQSNANANQLSTNLQTIKGGASVMPQFANFLQGKSILNAVNTPQASNLEHILSDKGLTLHIAHALATQIYNREASGQGVANAADTNAAAAPAQNNDSADNSAQVTPVMANLFAILVLMFAEEMKMENKVSAGETTTEGAIGQLQTADIEMNSQAVVGLVDTDQNALTTDTSTINTQIGNLQTEFHTYMTETISTSLSMSAASFALSSASVRGAAPAAGTPAAVEYDAQNWLGKLGTQFQAGLYSGTTGYSTMLTSAGGVAGSNGNSAEQVYGADNNFLTTKYNDAVTIANNTFNTTTGIASSNEQNTTAGTGQSQALVTQIEEALTEALKNMANAKDSQSQAFFQALQAAGSPLH